MNVIIYIIVIAIGSTTTIISNEHLKSLKNTSCDMKIRLSLHNIQRFSFCQFIPFGYSFNKYTNQHSINLTLSPVKYRIELPFLFVHNIS